MARTFGKQLLPDLASSFVSVYRTTMPETTSSEIRRKRKTNSFSVMVPSCPGPTWLRGLGTCPRWTGLNMSASQERIASYILFGIFLRQHIVFNCFTFSFSFGPCLGLFVMICPIQCSAKQYVVHWQLSATQLVSGLCPYSRHTQSRMNGCTDVDIILHLLGHSNRHLGDVSHGKSELCTLWSLVRFIT